MFSWFQYAPSSSVIQVLIFSRLQCSDPSSLVCSSSVIQVLVSSRFQYSPGSSVLQVLAFSRFQYYQVLVLSKFQWSPGSSVLQVLVLFRLQWSPGSKLLQFFVVSRFRVQYKNTFGFYINLFPFSQVQVYTMISVRYIYHVYIQQNKRVGKWSIYVVNAVLLKLRPKLYQYRYNQDTIHTATIL